MGKQEQLNQQLFTAAVTADVTGVKTAIAAGAEINVKNNEGYTPLHAAVALKNAEIGQVLLSYGADVNARDKHQTTPLHYAAVAGQQELIAALIDHGADANAKDGDGRSPIDWAQHAGKTDIVTMLKVSACKHTDRLAANRGSGTVLSPI